MGPPKPRRKGYGRVDHCVCHDIAAEDIAKRIKEGADSVVAVFRACGCKLDCGDCVPAIKRSLARANANNQTEATPMHERKKDHA